MKNKVSYIVMSMLLMIVVPLFLMTTYQINVETASVIGIFIGTLMLWITVDIGWPSLLCIGLLGMLPSVGYTKIMTLSFGNTTFVFLLLTFICTYALSQTPLIEKIAIKMLTSKFAQRGEWAFVISLMLTIYGIGLFISPTVFFMIILPIFDKILMLLHLEKGHKTTEFLAVSIIVALGLSTGATPISHVFSVMAMSIFHSITGITISYVDYMLMAIPVTVMILVLYIMMVKYIVKPNLKSLNFSDIAQLQSTVQKMAKSDYIVGIIFILTVLLWVIPDFIKLPIMIVISKYGLAFPPLLAIIMMSIITVNRKPLLNLQEAMTKGVHWPSLLLAGATLALGSVLTMDKIDVLLVLKTALAPLLTQLSPFWLVLFFVAWASIQTNLSSNLVTVSVVTPIAVSTLQMISPNTNSGVVASLIGLMASLAFATPPAMPYVAITIGQGYASSKKVLQYGFVVMIISIIVATVVGYYLGHVIYG